MKHLALCLVGILFGFILSRIGFGDFGAVHRMHLLADFRMFLAFAGGVVLSAAAFALLSARGAFPRRFHKGTIPGSILFGAGWAITGACPAIALVQLGQGQLAGLFTAFGIVAGVFAQRRAQARLRWSGDSCES